MKKRLPFSRLTCALLIFFGSDISALGAEAPPPNAAREKELVRLVRDDCGACHGRTLKGGLGPSLLPEDVRDLPPESLRETILKGRPNTAMPPWKSFLSESEAAWIVEQLQQGFPDEK